MIPNSSLSTNFKAIRDAMNDKTLESTKETKIDPPDLLMNPLIKLLIKSNIN